MKLLNAFEVAPDCFYISCNEDFSDNENGCRILQSGIFDNIEDLSIKEKYSTGELNYLINNKGAYSTELTETNEVVNRRVSGCDPSEELIEQYRRTLSPLFPSRISCVFAFDNYEICRICKEKYSWEHGKIRKYRLIEDKATRVIRCNMEIISTFRELLVDTNQKNVPNLFYNSYGDLCRNYWFGTGSIDFGIFVSDDNVYKSNVNGRCRALWEYLIEGRLELVEEF